MALEFDLKIERGAFTLDATAVIPSSGICVIFGASGSGKTTLLRSIAGLDPAVGTIKIHNSTVSAAAHRRNIGLVFQNPVLPEHMTVGALLCYAMGRGTYKDLDNERSRIVNALGLAPLLDKTPRQLSGGQKQRVAIAAAIARQPKMLLMDEPLTALDRKSRSELITAIKQLRHEFSMQILYVTHSHREVAALADHLLVMEDGRVTQSGTFEEVWQQIANNPYKYDLEGSYLSGRVCSYDPKYHLLEVDVGGQSLQMLSEFNGHLRGSLLRFFIPANHITISGSAFPKTSSLNQITLYIRSIDVSSPVHARLMCDFGPNQSIIVLVTKKSLDELGLSVNQPVFASIKATSIASSFV